MPEEFAIKSIESKYQKSFDMISSRFSTETGNYEIMACPDDNPDLVFSVEHNPKTNNVNDYYPYAKWQYEASDYFHGILGALDQEHTLSVGVKNSTEFDPLELPSFTEVLDASPEHLNLNFFMHIFEKPTENSCEPILALDNLLRDKGLKKVGFSVSFYDPTNIPPMDEHPPYGFNAQSNENFEKLHADAFIGLIKYRIDFKGDSEPKASDLLKIMVDNANSMKFYKL